MLSVRSIEHKARRSDIGISLKRSYLRVRSGVHLNKTLIARRRTAALGELEPQDRSLGNGRPDLNLPSHQAQRSTCFEIAKASFALVAVSSPDAILAREVSLRLLPGMARPPHVRSRRALLKPAELLRGGQ